LEQRGIQVSGKQPRKTLASDFNFATAALRQGDTPKDTLVAPQRMANYFRNHTHQHYGCLFGSKQLVWRNPIIAKLVDSFRSLNIFMRY